MQAQYSKVDTLAKPMLAKAARKGIDPRTCPVEDLKALSMHCDAVVRRLSRSPASIAQLAERIGEYSMIAPEAATRTATQVILFLLLNGRVTKQGGGFALMS